MGKRKRHVPEVLRRAYGDRVRTLEETLLSLLPPPPPSPEECTCQGRICFGCDGANFLIRPGDAAEYRELLTRGFCVVSPDAPVPTDLHFGNRMPPRMKSHSIPNDELFCTSTWYILLARLGNPMMNFLLKFTSIFVPLSSRHHHQVTGRPLNEIIQNLKCGYKSKRNGFRSKVRVKGSVFRINENENRVNPGSFNTDTSSSCQVISATNLLHLLGEEGGSNLLDKMIMNFSLNGQKCCSYFINNSLNNNKPFVVENIHPAKAFEVFPESNDDMDVPLIMRSFDDDSTYGCGGKTRKRLRLFSWQRHKKHRKLNDSGETFLRTICSCTVPYKGLTPNSCCQAAKCMSSFTHGGTTHFCGLKVKSECIYCLMSQALSNVALNTQINRISILHSSMPSCSAFPKNHILNRLKPNTTDADFLMRRIFGLSEGFLGTYFSPSTNCSGAFSQFNCLYHSLLKLLKLLIQNAHHCQILKLLDKHCPSGWHSSGTKGAKTNHEPEGNISSFDMAKKQVMGLQHSPGNILPRRSSRYRTQAAHAFEEASTVCCPQSDLSGSYCEHDRVVSFIWAVSRSIVPLDLLGDSSTWRALRKNISKFIRLRRFENFSLKQCMHGLKISSFAFLSQKMQHSRCSCSSRIDNIQWNKDISGKPHTCQMNLKKQLLQCWIYWYFSFMIIPMVRTNFYVTEKEGGRQDVFYYPKPIWRKLIDQSITFLQEHNYREMDFAVFRSIICRRSFGFSKVRFLPKGKGARPLANLKAPSKAWFPVKKGASQNCSAKMGSSSRVPQKKAIYTRRKIVHFRSVNSALGDVGAILKRIKAEHPEHLGSSVFDYNDVYRILHPFLSGLRTNSGNMPKVFIVVSDVSKAFDSIDQDRLLDIMKDVLQEDVFHFRRYAQVICSKKSLGTLYGPIYINESKKSSTKFANSVQLCSSHGVLVDQGKSRYKNKEELHNLLHEHVKCNVVQLGDSFYLQQVGISQGSSLSSLLCSFYYGHMERNVILPFLLRNCKQSHCNFSGNDGQSSRLQCASEVLISKADSRCATLGPGKKELEYLPSSGSFHTDTDINCNSDRNVGFPSDIADRICKTVDESDYSSFPKHVLLRLVDDFLFISTSEKLATTFFNRLQRGFREYNCFMNGDKLRMNFDVTNNPKTICNRMYTGADGMSFLPWGGLLVNCQTLEIQADYTRYWAVHLSSTLTVRMHDKLGPQLKAKLCAYMRPKCHPLFYDSSINSPATIRLNAYQAFLLCAMKFHCYISMLAKTRPSPKYCADIIQGSLSYMYKLIKKRMYDAEHYCNIRPLLRLKKAEVMWLGLSAYIRVLKKKQSRYVELLSLLRTKLDSIGKMDHSSSHLKYAVDDSHSSFLWKITY